MRRIWSVTGNLVVLAAVAVLAVVLVKFGGLRGEQPTPQVGVFQSPIEPPPTPIAPPPTPTSEPTPIPVATVVPGPLPPGLKIVCVDRGEDDRTSVIWMANVNDLAHVQIIGKLPSPWGTPGGYISPDGRQLAYIIPGKSVWEGTLGVMNIDGSDNKVLDAPVLGWGTETNLLWSPDSRWMAYPRYILSEKGGGGETQIWLIHHNGIEKRLLTTALDAWPVGWSRDGSQLYYDTGSELWAVNVDGKGPPLALIHFDPPASIVRLSPDGQRILYLTRESRPAAPVTLGVVSLDGKEKRVLVENVNPRDFAFENYQLHPIWSPDSTQVVYNAMVDRTHTEILAARWDASKTERIGQSREEVYHYPISWSPDGKFIVVSIRQPLGPEGRFYRALVRLDGSVQEIYSMKPDSLPPGFIGWLEDKEEASNE